MTPPAGPEEVREWSYAETHLPVSRVDEHNALARAYVALQARVEMHELNVSALGKRIGALCDELEAAQARIAKLEQERGRGGR